MKTKKDLEEELSDARRRFLKAPNDRVRVHFMRLIEKLTYDVKSAPEGVERRSGPSVGKRPPRDPSRVDQNVVGPPTSERKLKAKSRKSRKKQKIHGAPGMIFAALRNVQRAKGTAELGSLSNLSSILSY